MGAMSEAVSPPPLESPEGDGGGALPAHSDHGEGIWARASDAFARWRAGETRAMDDLVRTMTPVLWQVVRAYGVDRMLAEDVVQATWFTLVRRHESIHDDRAVAGWLTTCARREVWRVGRAQQRDRPTEDILLEPLLPDDESAEERALTSDRDRRLWHAVGALDERCRRLLRIVAFEERPDYARIAGDLGMPIGSIGPTRGRCLGKLRTALAHEGMGGDPHADSRDEAPRDS